MKKIITTLLLIIMVMSLAGCGGKANKLVGTWKVDSVEIDGARFTVSEFEAMSEDGMIDNSMIDAQLVIKDGGKVYVSDGDSEAIVDWSETEDGVTIGEQEGTIVDNMICLEYGDSKMYFKKISESQTIGDAQKEDTEVKTDDEKTSEPTGQTAEKEPEQTETNSETNSEKNVPADPIEELNGQVDKDIVDTLAALTKEYEQLITDVDTYDKYAENVDKVEAFYEKINQTHKELCIRMREYSIVYAEKTLASDSSNEEKYDELEELYDNVYEYGGDEIYDGFYDGILKDVYDDFYDGILDDGQDTAEYSEWMDLCSQEYEWWLDTSSDVYEQWLDYRSEVYEFWLDLRGEVLYGDIEKAKEIIAEFQEDISKLKENKGSTE